MPHIALYPGTFDPLTKGHLDILLRAEKLCDQLIVGVASNERKSPLFSLEERISMLEEAVRNIQTVRAEIHVLPFQDLLINFAQSIGATTIMRGLRAVSDFEYEFQILGMNRKMNPDIETVFLMADPDHQAIASKLVKEIAAFGGDVTPFVTDHVAQKLKEIFVK